MPLPAPEQDGDPRMSDADERNPSQPDGSALPDLPARPHAFAVPEPHVASPAAAPTYAPPPTNVYVVQQPMYTPPQPRGFSVTALILGLVSIVFGFTFLVPLGALIFGLIGVKREPSARGMAITGIVIGGAFMLFWLLLGGAILTLFLGLLGTAATYGTAS